MMTPKECRTVAHFLIEEMLQGEVAQPVDIRTYVEHAIPAYLQHRDGRTTVPWQDIVRSKLAGQVNREEKRGDRNERLQQLALAISVDKDLERAKKVEKWKKETGLGQAIYYRHLKSAKVK